MIRITCTHCRQVLTIDEGFAGGVCRCQHCGTIQTVPALKSGGRGAAQPAKTLYRGAEQTPGHHREPRRDGDHSLSDSSLDELAEIVSSSGLRSNSRRLRQPIPSGSVSAFTPPRQPRRTLPLIFAIVIIVVLLAIVAVLLYKNKTIAPAPAPSAPAAPMATAAPALSPNFAGMEIEAQDTVVYLLDDGGSASGIIPSIQTACYQSIKSLGPERRFKVIFWRDGSPAYPADGTARATDEEEANCEAALRDAYAQGNTVVDGALKTAMAAQPDAVVLVTAKAAQLPDDFAQSVLSQRGDARTRFYTVGINGDSSADASKPGVLATLAAQTNGQFLNISSSDLDRLGH
jgi:hypothetical protein